MPCLCGANGGRLIAELDRYGLPSPSVLCRSCGLIRTTPRLTDDSLEAFYANDYRPLYDGFVDAQESFLRLQRTRGLNIMSFTKGFLGEGSRVVDLGCGAGYTLLAFEEDGHRVAGCDLGSAYLEAGRARGLDLRHGDYSVLAEMAPFDLVILSHVFEHLADPRQLARDIGPFLSPDGLIYIEVPGIQSIPVSHADPLCYFQNAHLWSFDLGTLTDVMAEAGYRRVKGTEFVRAIFTPDASVLTNQGQNGFLRVSRALSYAEAMRNLSHLRRGAKTAARKLLGDKQASRLKRVLGRVP